MIVVRIDKFDPAYAASWPCSSLGSWLITQEKLDTFGAIGDVLAVVSNNTVVAVFEIAGHCRDVHTRRVGFSVVPSSSWSHLIGNPNPASPWGTRFSRWPVKFVETDMLGREDRP